jgi:2-haloacid dehalogenase
MRDVARLTTVVFDLGGVLIDWDPRHLYRQLFDDPDEMESFLAEVTTAEWNGRQDAGRPWAEAIEILVAEHPERRELIEAFQRRWPEMLAGEIPGTVDVLADLRAAGVGLSHSATGQRRCSRSPGSGSTSWHGSRGSSSRARSE